jgi:hypothetical protein
VGVEELRVSRDLLGDYAFRAGRLQAVVVALRGLVDGQPSHRYEGGCPDEECPEDRDARCPACQALVRIDAVLVELGIPTTTPEEGR